MTWRLGELRDEAWRSIGTVQTVAGIVAGALGAALVLLGQADLDRALGQRAALEGGGSTVMTARADSGESLEAADCARLGSATGVLAAGGYFGEDATVIARWLPSGLGVPVVDVSLAGLQVWWPEVPPGGGVFVGNDLAATTGLGPGSVVELEGRSVVVGERLPVEVLPTTVQAGLVRVVPGFGPAHECWFRVVPGAPDAVAELVTSAFPNHRVVAQRYLEPGTGVLTPTEVLTAGPSGGAWWAALTAMTAGWVALGLVERREWAVYRALGTTGGEIALLSVIRFAMTALPAAAVATLLAVVAGLLTGGPWGPDVVWYLVQPVTCYLAGAVVTAAVVPVLTSAGSIADVLRE